MIANSLSSPHEHPSSKESVRLLGLQQRENLDQLPENLGESNPMSGLDEDHFDATQSPATSNIRTKAPWRPSAIVSEMGYKSSDAIQRWMKELATRMTTIDPPNLTTRPLGRPIFGFSSPLNKYERANLGWWQNSQPDGAYSSGDNDTSSMAHLQAVNANSMGSVIEQLESLLNEALLMARSVPRNDNVDKQDVPKADESKLIPSTAQPDSFESRDDRQSSVIDYHRELAGLYQQRAHDANSAKPYRDDSSSDSSEWSETSDLFRVGSMLEDQGSGSRISPGSTDSRGSRDGLQHPPGQSNDPEKAGRPHSRSYSSFDWATPQSAGKLKSTLPPDATLEDQNVSMLQNPTPALLPGKEQQNHLQRADPTSTLNPRPGYLNRPPRLQERHSGYDDSNVTGSYIPRGETFSFPGAENGKVEQPGLDGLPDKETSALSDRSPAEDHKDGDAEHRPDSLENRRHVSISKHRRLNLSRSHRRAPIARDWRTSRKRMAATTACINTALMGIIIGIYAGLVPAIQYAIVDENHYAILGNVVFFLGLAITTAFFYPLPLLHGRKPYVLAALACLMPLQFPPALIVSQQRSPDDLVYRTGLLVSRAVAGLVMGFVNINAFTTLLDLFGSSLQSGNPHEEVVIEHDPRRHGGGMGLWLGIWTWCFLGSIGLGFFIGAMVISGLNVAWGFWVIIILTVAVLVLNVLTPETRRSAYRRSMAEVKKDGEVSRRIAKGEIMMHLYSTGPLHWWEEVRAGIVLNIRVIKQPGFVIFALYQGWMFAQFVIVIILLGALTSRDYRFQPQTVAVCVASLPLGGLLAVPFQKASLFSRSRHHAPRTDSMTFEKRVTWSSHLVRRAIFMIVLPFAGLAYTLTSSGRVHVAAPCIFAALIGFLSSLALSECIGIMMETFDTSDLQAGMTGRRRSVVPEKDLEKRTNYSSYPRVTSAMVVSQTFAFILAAGSTAWGGVIERAVGAQAATGIMAGILLLLTLLLIGALTRFKTVQIVPSARVGTNILKGPSEDWMPVIIGTPSGTTRRISLLELGNMTRWTEIRRRNRLIDQGKM